MELPTAATRMGLYYGGRSGLTVLLLYKVSVCPFGSLFFDHEKAKAKKCDLCGGKPTCVEFCPTQALQYMDGREPFIAKNVRINLFYKSLSDIRMRDLSRH